MKDGFIKVAACVPEIRPGECAGNALVVAALAREMAENGVKAACFTELCLTGYTMGSLFYQRVLLEDADMALTQLMEDTADLDLLFAVGMPVLHGDEVISCAAVIYKGELLYMIPKGDSQAFYVPSAPEFCFGFEVGGDLLKPPEKSAVIAFNLSAWGEQAGGTEFRRDMISALSAQSCCAYVCAGAGAGESTADAVYSGHCVIAENGRVLAERQWHPNSYITADVDAQKLAAQRLSRAGFSASPGRTSIELNMPVTDTRVDRAFSRTPFVPSSKKRLLGRCGEVLAIQSAGLRQRLSAIGCRKAVIGLSGGMDSTLALLVIIDVFDKLNLPRENIIAVTMPCFGTTERTLRNVCKLAGLTGVTLREIPLRETVARHLSDIGHDGKTRDVTYENAQARERTQVLMDLANMEGGIVVGTGSLSEIALGWSTYNGDHMSMYNPNCGVPKTLVRYLIAYYTLDSDDKEFNSLLGGILDTPISPELLPPEKSVDHIEEAAQKTEDIIGPYELHDFFLYYFVRYGFTPEKIFRIAAIAFDGAYSGGEIKKWLVVFLRRFFSMQFKRGCAPDGPRVGSVSLSPRGGWLMPSDISGAAWIERAERIII